jgi:CheY-like chemotaxis protein
MASAMVVTVSDRTIVVEARVTRILIVDDEMTIRELLTDLLTDEGYAVSSAPNGVRALELLTRDMPDLVIMDVMMPEMDGREVLRRMKASPALCQIPVIIMSAAVSVDRPDSTAQAFLAKPFDLHELLDSIDRILDHHTH